MKTLEKIKEYNNKKSEIIADFKEKFFQELFDKYDNLQFIPIISYTPYFNDGEPCERDTTFYLNYLDVGMQYLTMNVEKHQVLELITNPEELFVIEAEEDEEYDEDALLGFLRRDAFDSKELNSYTINKNLTVEEIKEIEQTLKSVVEFIEEILEDHTITLVKRQGKDVVILTAEYEHD